MTGDLGSGTEALVGAPGDRYRIERELGRGGMATVFLAEDIRHQRRVAIKVLRPELAAVVGGERFLREIRTTATLQHSHILGLIDSGEFGGLPYYVMPFVDGESLRDRLTREHQLRVAEAVRIAKELSPDGKAFVMVRRTPATRIMVIQNLPALVSRLQGP